MIKRSIDIIVSVILLMMLSPLLLVLIFMINIKLGSPIFFKQKRPGLKEKSFNLLKFRTMTNVKDDDGNLLSDELRLTNFGKMLRSTSMDELPSLINVLKGDMSLVGPRPLLVEYLPLYSMTQRKRHLVRPGITGWAQVNGRNQLSWEEKFELDVWYVENESLKLDIIVLFKTVKKVILKDGISAKEHATMPKFIGSKDEK